ncbi:NUDIX domain-containing protein [Streptomyces cinnamoneus]|uniref:Nudix hydrolase domain-containing protein n=1 Tax=Streptomyces cinnamoneus TaxID=53446 RepID=A0A918TU59_STRCJ|nr:NUDIX domain-containing protein [Streptomyces cinnamoneus]GHC60136.1 hypothetical protein GCM10010507_41460 [Streptomyces cinnamoneus]
MSASDPFSCPVDVMVLLHRSDGRVLLLRRPNDLYDAGALTPPAGPLQPGEPVTDRAVREVHRQAGVAVDPGALEFCHLVHHRTPAGTGRLGVVFTAQHWSGRPRLTKAGVPAGVVWAEPARPPAGCSPYAASVLSQFSTGALLSTHGWTTTTGGTA